MGRILDYQLEMGNFAMALRCFTFTSRKDKGHHKMLSWNTIHISNLKIILLIVYTLNKLADTLANNNSNLKVYTLTDSVTFSI